MATKKTATVTTLAVAQVTSVATGIAAVDAKLAQLQHIQDSVYKTSGKLPPFGDIKTETDLSNLIKALSSVQGREEAYHKAAATLELGNYPVFKIEGGTRTEWEADIKLRIQMIQHKSVYDKLVKIKKEYTELMDKEDRMQLLTAELAGI